MRLVRLIAELWVGQGEAMRVDEGVGKADHISSVTKGINGWPRARIWRMLYTSTCIMKAAELIFGRMDGKPCGEQLEGLAIHGHSKVHKKEASFRVCLPQTSGVLLGFSAKTVS